jgi:hypothetical protein
MSETPVRLSVVVLAGVTMKASALLPNPRKPIVISSSGFVHDDEGTMIIVMVDEERLLTVK